MSMYAEDFTNTVVISEGRKYKISKIETIDLSEQKEKPEGTIQVTHVIEGFDVPIYFIIDNEDDSFTFGMYVGQGVPLLVTVTDEEVFKRAVQLVASLEDEEN
ncbi:MULTISPECIES: hypothetical protein [Bacillus cereus group]|uniref:DUF1292 domain-containing protein n=2 Tax=Bacillus cereus TaxID=1396 RepID=A0A9W7QK75_BACCE|nr:hypothetical protein [Bacillus cereus]KAB2400712.1 hypothetical protein F8172_00085 [Bacillus cereus]KAB2410907.1 hypothetical protein F8170_00005 [Bacillus cereus]KAB2431035.1 hypothetical protein F8168_05855 [Bacillus cereus]